MKINFLYEEVIKGEKSIFLAGPILNSENNKSWRIEACAKLNKLGFDGVIYVPEDPTKTLKSNNQEKTIWEKEALEESTIILFWIPKNLEDIPAFATDSEPGYYMSTGKVVYGRPDNMSKTKYIDWLYTFDYNEKPYSNLDKLLEESINKVNKTINNNIKVLKK